MGSVGGTEDRMLVDLHLHSRASGTATNWWVKGLGADVEARESYTPPEEAYRMAKGAGMDFVTLTDHETIDGALTLTHHPDFFAGEEVSAYLPEEGGYVDVPVYGLDGEAHREAQARRGDAHELVAYLREAGVVHVLAHPIYAMPGPLDRGAVEKRLVMFGLWEFINGSRPAQQNRLAREIAGSVGPVELRQMALRHGLPTPPHRGISGTGGSDDHGGIYGGATHTVLPKVESAKELLDALAASETRPAGEDGSVAKMIHTGFRLAGAAIGEGEDGRALRVLRGLTFRPAILRRSRAAWAGPYQGRARRPLRGPSLEVSGQRGLGVPGARLSELHRELHRRARIYRAVRGGARVLRPGEEENPRPAPRAPARGGRELEGRGVRGRDGRDPRRRHHVPQRPGPRRGGARGGVPDRALRRR